MSYYALKDVDWPWDDETEGRAIVVRADTPEEAVRIATEKHLAEYPGAGGVTWDVSLLHLVAFGDASWEEDNRPVFEALTYYCAGINGAPDTPSERIRSALTPTQQAEPEAYVVEGPGWKRVFLSKEAAEIMAKPENSAVIPLYALAALNAEVSSK